MDVVIILLGAAAVAAVVFGLQKFIDHAAKTQAPNGPQSKNKTHKTTTDAYEGSFWELRSTYGCDAQLMIDYTDAYKARTQRTVDVTAFGNDGSNGCFSGFCRLRNEPRTFRYDRVRECVDIETGEIINDIHAHLLAKYESSPNKSMDIMQTDNTDILRALFYVGKADGSLRAQERAIILATCHRFTGDKRITDTMLQKLLRNLERPTLSAFNLATERLKAHPIDKRAWIIDAAERIVATQKTIHPAERAAIEYLHQHLGQA